MRLVPRELAKEALLREAKRRQIDPWTRYATDPVGFARDILGLTVWSRQAQTLTEVLEHGKSAVRAGRKVSKSNTIAVLALHNSLARGAPTLLTSSSFDQLKAIVWAELATMAARARLPIDVPLDPRTGFRTPTGGLVVGRSTNKRENMQGYSGADALYIGDEASGLSAEIVEALEGNLAGGGRLALFGNPTMTSGPFFDAFHAKRGTWHGIHISSRESPNVTGEVAIPGLATAEWIRQTERENGPSSAFVEVHVDGDFPTSGSTNVISLQLVTAARERWEAEAEDGTLTIGLDVARYGSDPTVLQAVRGAKALQPVARHGLDGPAAAGLVIAWVDEYRARTGYAEPVPVRVDVIGVGASAYDALHYSERAAELGINAEPVNVAERATSTPNEGGYALLRDQLWFAMRDWLLEGGALPPEPLIEQELVAPQFRFDAQGRYKVESKDDVRERIHRSTDHADALALAIYDPPDVRPMIHVL